MAASSLVLVNQIISGGDADGNPILMAIFLFPKHT